VLLGNYVLANFAATSDGHGGTSVIDPPLAFPMPPAASVSIVPVETPAGTPAATTPAVAPTAVAPPEFATVAVATAAVIDSTGAVTASAPALAALPASPPSMENASLVGGSGLSGETSVVILSQASGGLVTPAVAPPDKAVPEREVPQTAIAREVVSPDDLILAIRKGDIAFKIDPPAGESSERSPWLFDAERGTFEAPPSEQLTIFVEGDDDDDGLARTQTGNPGFMPASAGEAMVVPDQSWFGAIRMAWMQPTRNWWWR
jgi:hypothetical protein